MKARNQRNCISLFLRLFIYLKINIRRTWKPVKHQTKSSHRSSNSKNANSKKRIHWIMFVVTGLSFAQQAAFSEITRSFLC